MSSDTLAHMLEHWDEISEGEGKIDLPFNIEEFCRENDHRISDLKAENERLLKEKASLALQTLCRRQQMIIPDCDVTDQDIEIDELRERIAELEAELEKCTMESAFQIAECKILRRKYAELEAEICSMNDAGHKLIDENERLRKKVAIGSTIEREIYKNDERYRWCIDNCTVYDSKGRLIDLSNNDAELTEINIDAAMEWE